MFLSDSRFVDLTCLQWITEENKSAHDKNCSWGGPECTRLSWAGSTSALKFLGYKMLVSVGSPSVFG
jgi:hypothetical protein